jgi:multicomponent Na+:H+ antiporter subunit D
MIGPIAVLAGITISIGLLAEPLYTLSLEAGEQLMNPDAYIEAVLGGSR